MAEVLMSEAERTYILHGVQDNLRCDGRGSEDYRRIDLDTSVVSNSSGSARIRLAHTDVIVGVKAELGEPAIDRPNEGRLQFSVCCSANATPKFEGRGGDDLANEICSVLTRAYDHPNCLDLASLSVIARQQCWVLCIDILVLECSGNLLDAISIAVKAALYNTKLPKLVVSTGEKGEYEVELEDDPFECQRLDVTNVPCIVTLNKIGHYHIVDATMEEEACSLARLRVGVTGSGSIVTLKKDGPGSLHPDSIADMVETAMMVGRTISEHLMSQLEAEERMARKVARKATRGGEAAGKTGLLR